MKRDRQSIRLKGYDYSAEGAYFVTIVCKDRLPWFGEIVDGEMQLTDAGKIVEEEWLHGAELRSEITLDAFVVMPNHFHGIVVIGEPLVPLAGVHGKGVPRHAPTPMGSKPNTLGTIVRMFKQACTKRIRQSVSADFAWLRGYHDRIIRNQEELQKIQSYIQNNSAMWNEDRFNSRFDQPRN
ncbi:MAG: transposase [Flavobacteriales bacterium]|nr:transposase [Flavobacteriales bacterium]